MQSKFKITPVNKESATDRLPIKAMLVAIFCSLVLSGCSYSTFDGGVADVVVSPFINLWNFLYEVVVIDISSVPQWLWEAIHHKEYINPFMNPTSPMYSVWTYLSEFAWCMVMLSIVLRFGSWVFFDKTPDWKKVFMTWCLSIFLIVGAPLLGVAYIRFFYGSGECNVRTADGWLITSKDACDAAMGKWQGQNLLNDSLEPKSNGLISVLAGFSGSGTTSTGATGGATAQPVIYGKYACLSSLIKAGNERVAKAWYKNTTIGKASTVNAIWNWFKSVTWIDTIRFKLSNAVGLMDEKGRIVSGTNTDFAGNDLGYWSEEYMRWRLLSYAGGTSINGEGFGTFLTQEAIDDVNRGNNDTPSLFYGCYAIANKLYQAGGIDERFDTSLDTLNGIYKLMDAAHSTNGNFAAGKNDTDLVNAMKELLSGYYVSLKKKYDSPPAERIVTDGVESFYTIGITECANPKYKANICSDIRTLFPEIKNPEEIFAPDVSPVSILSLIFISFIYIFIYAVYWVFSVWTQFALIVLPILGMLLLIRPKYLTGSFQFMLGPYFLKMIISLITAILVSIVGIEGIVDAGFEALFVLVLLCGLTVLAVPEVMGFVNQILGGIQQYISSEQSGYSPDSAIAAALSASKNAMSKWKAWLFEDEIGKWKKKGRGRTSGNLPGDSDYKSITAESNWVLANQIGANVVGNGKWSHRNSIENDAALLRWDGKRLADLKKSMELQTAEMERQANSGMVSKVEGVTDAIGDIDGIDEVGGGVIQNLDGALNTGANAILSGKETAEAIVETMSMEDPITKESEARRESVGDMIRSAIHNASGFAIGAKDAVEWAASATQETIEQKKRGFKEMGRAAFRTAAREYKKSGLKSVLESDLDLTSKVFQGTISGVGWSLRKGASMASSAVGSGLNAIHNATMPTTMAASAIDGALAKSMAGGISAGSAGGFDSGISGVKGVVTNSNFGSEGRQGSTASDKKETGQDVKIENMVSEGSAKKKLQAAEESANAVIKAEELVEKKREERKKENEKANEIKRAEEAEKDRIAKENEKRIEEAKGEHSITTASVANMDSPVGEKTPDIPKPPYNTLDSYPDFGNLFQQSIATNPNPSTNPWTHQQGS